MPGSMSSFIRRPPRHDIRVITHVMLNNTLLSLLGSVSAEVIRATLLAASDVVDDFPWRQLQHVCHLPVRQQDPLEISLEPWKLGGHSGETPGPVPDHARASLHALADMPRVIGEFHEPFVDVRREIVGPEAQDRPAVAVLYRHGHGLDKPVFIGDTLAREIPPLSGRHDSIREYDVKGVPVRCLPVIVGLPGKIRDGVHEVLGPVL